MWQNLFSQCTHAKGDNQIDDRERDREIGLSHPTCSSNHVMLTYLHQEVKSIFLLLNLKHGWKFVTSSTSRVWQKLTVYKLEGQIKMAICPASHILRMFALEYPPTIKKQKQTKKSSHMVKPHVGMLINIFTQASSQQQTSIIRLIEACPFR